MLEVAKEILKLDESTDKLVQESIKIFGSREKLIQEIELAIYRERMSNRFSSAHLSLKDLILKIYYDYIVLYFHVFSYYLNITFDGKIHAQIKNNSKNLMMEDFKLQDFSDYNNDVAQKIYDAINNGDIIIE